MARIPDVQDDPVEGAPPSTQSVQPTNFNLDQIGGELNRTAGIALRANIIQMKAQAQADRQYVAPAVDAFQSRTRDQAAADVGQWNGSPGFATDQIAKMRAAASQADQNLQGTPGQHAEFQRQANEHIAQFGQQLIDHEASVRQQFAMAPQEMQASAATTNVVAASAPAIEALKDNYDGSQPGLTAAALKVHDDAVAAAQPSVPPVLLPRWQAEMNARRAELAANLGSIEQHAQDGFVYKSALTQGQTAVNTIRNNPTAFSDVMSNVLPGIAAAIPGAMPGIKKDVLTQLQGQAVEARIDGLIGTGNAAQAQAEMKDGRYAAYLPPQAYDALNDKALAAARSNMPVSVDQAVAQQQTAQRAQAETAALLTTGQSTGMTAADLKGLSLEKAAEFITQWGQAQKQYAAGGAVRDMDSQHLQALATSAGDPAAPDYQTRLIQQQEAQKELTQRAAGAGAWAMDTSAHGAPAKGAGAGGAGVAQNRGLALQTQWQSLTTLQGDAQRQAAQQYATAMLSAQAGVGIQPAARQIVDQKTAAQLAASVINAPDGQKMAAIQAVAATIHALPGSVTLPDGSKANPQAMLVAQLRAAHLSPADIQPIADFGTDPTGAKLGAYVAAQSDPELKKPLGHGQDAQLMGFIRNAMQPYLNAVAANPGAEALNQARLSNGALVARYYMAHQGMSMQDAAQTAAKNQTGDVRYMGTWYMPAALAGGVGVDPSAHGFDLGDAGIQSARAGAAHLLGALTANNGANLLQSSGPNPIAAQQVLHNGQWRTLADESGLQLLVPKPGGGFTPVLDKFGRPVQATWDQLHSQASGNAPAPFATPPANQPVVNGQPVPGFSRQQAFADGVKSITSMESGGRDGLTSDQGAMGRMQVLPATAAPYAQRIFGQPLDQNRLLNDGAYNTKIGTAIWGDLVNKYGPSPGGLAKAYAGYFAGPGNVDGYTDAKGYHPGFVQRFGDPASNGQPIDKWIAQLPPKTQAYVTTGIQRHFRLLMSGQ